MGRTAGMSLGLAAMLLLAGMLAACEEQARSCRGYRGLVALVDLVGARP